MPTAQQSIYYANLISAWNAGGIPSSPAGTTGTSITSGMTTTQKIAAVDSWMVTGTIPSTIYCTGAQIANCINYTEFKALTVTQQANIMALITSPGPLLGGSANTSFLTVGMIIDYFATRMTISSGTYNNSTGIVTLAMSGSVGFGVGGTVTINSLTGTGAFASLNGSWQTIAPTNGTTVTFQAPAGLGVTTITGGSLTPPTITAMTALAEASIIPWWQVPQNQGGGGLSSPVTQTDCDAAGLS